MLANTKFKSTGWYYGRNKFGKLKGISALLTPQSLNINPINSRGISDSTAFSIPIGDIYHFFNLIEKLKRAIIYTKLEDCIGKEINWSFHWEDGISHGHKVTDDGIETLSGLIAPLDEINTVDLEMILDEAQN